MNVGSSRVSPIFSCKAEIIMRLIGCLMLVGITIGLQSVITMHFTNGIGMLWEEIHSKYHIEVIHANQTLSSFFLTNPLVSRKLS